MRLITLLLTVYSISEAAKILVYSPIFGHSHTKYLASIAEILTEEKHDVTVLMPIVDESEREKHCLKKVTKRIFVEADKDVARLMADKNSMMAKVWTSNQGNPLELLDMAKNMSRLFAGSCSNLMQQTDLLNQLKAEKFDLGIVEPFSQCGLAVFHVIGLKNYVSALSSIRFDHVSQAVGEPTASSFVPGTMSVFSDQMTLKQRLLNTIQTFVGSYIFSIVGDSEFQAAREFYPDLPDWRELNAHSIFVFPSTIPFLDFPAPTISKVVPIGGISVNAKKAANKLPEKWDKVLNERKQTVFISFGSNAKSVGMPAEFKKSLIELFASLPDVTFIWKYEDEKDTLVDHLPNVHLGSWLPQTDLLADERLSLFITHGGLGSTMELATLGKASIVIPLFADQYRNANMLSRHGGALALAKEDLAKHRVLKATIENILSDKSYSENAEKLANVLQNQPTNARETLLKHIEFAAKFGQQPHTDPYGRKLSFWQYYLIDALLLVVFVLSFVLFVIYKVTKLVLSTVCRIRSKSKLE